MTATQLTRSPTEADLEAEIPRAIRKVFPWLPADAIRHQTRFSFNFGHATIDIEGARNFQAEGRTDALVRWNETPLAVLELKRAGLALTAADVAQALSYASVIRPRFPLVVVTNGDETRILDSYSGEELEPGSMSEETFHKLVTAAAKAAGHDLKNAVSTLMGSHPTVWMQAVRGASQAYVDELSGAWDDPTRPFVRGFLFPRKASAVVEAELERGKRLLLVEGAPLVGKSSLLREMVWRTADSADMAVLFIPADEGSGVFQAVADLLTSALAWPVTAEEARTWLARLSRADGPALVLAVDGVGPEHDRLRRDLEDLSSPNFGAQLRLVVTVDDAVVKKLVDHAKGRQASAIGRRVDARIELDLLDDDEFEQAAGQLWDHRLAVMHGSQSTAELRVPWILRALGGRYAPDPGERLNRAAVLPAQLSLDLIGHTRERFRNDELRRQFREIAKAVLTDAEDTKRPIALMLESMATFVVRRQTLLQFLALSEVESLMTRGYLKPSLHASGEPVLFVRLPELLASEASAVLSPDLIERARNDAADMARSLVEITSRLPLGDIIAACAFADAMMHGNSGVPLDAVSALVEMPPKKTPITPGMKVAMHVPGIGMMDMTFQDDGSFVGEFKGHRHTFPVDPDEGLGEMIGDYHAWLILSHLAGQRIGFIRQDETVRIDLELLAKIGRCPHVLRRPDTVIHSRGVLTHHITGYGQIVCHAAGIVEPLTFSLFRRVSEEGPALEDWIRSVVAEGSLALLARLDAALRETAKLADNVRRPWAQRMLSEFVGPAFRDALQRAAI
ncbi:type I restriction enzyme HsdR N-terminal domain-containing protein [Bradyrhizobium sp. IC3123]|uniref:type I restriction enzyme HsdR N-terminal domain-containing protein n=1 Tax=Bradyrhizobium sp. IC3123 TaxID=2793803 RepID=UPI001CD2A90D|nr:type I restriction enzyme HsdR N-terminal domain-containing protein [Bradyrhizobium sp. IC3123]MCA1394553.1 type I restriction enzyme HsdR N-terminal domain-containing protein [Bradyrhizobium sp. IC3123]